jgi:hypothetical protein
VDQGVEHLPKNHLHSKGNGHQTEDSQQDGKTSSPATQLKID